MAETWSRGSFTSYFQLICFLNTFLSRFVSLKFSPIQSQFDNSLQMTRNKMSETLRNDPRLISRLVPDFAMGCRRLGPAEGFLEAMLEPNVELADDAVGYFTPKGLMTAKGTEYEADVIICATGFDVSFRPYFPIIGRGGKLLADHWSKDPEAYFALAASGFPNFMRKICPWARG